MNIDADDFDAACAAAPIAQIACAWCGAMFTPEQAGDTICNSDACKAPVVEGGAA